MADKYLIAQYSTSDWRDEQWVIGYGLYVNTLVYSCLKIIGKQELAENMRRAIDRFTITGSTIHHHVYEGQDSKPMGKSGKTKCQWQTLADFYCMI